MNKRKKKTNKSGKFWALVLILVVAYFSTQGDLSALSELPALDNLPSLSEVVSSKETPSNPKTPSSGKVKPTEGLEIPALEKKRKEVILYRSNYTLSFNKETNLPNWVAWRLDKKKLAQMVNRERYGFAADPDMEGGNREDILLILYMAYGLFSVNLSDLFDNNSQEVALLIRIYVRNLSDAS